MCAIDTCDERFEVYRLSEHRAAKTHKCDECGRQISMGERYLYAFGVYDGRGESYHICGHCKIATDWLRANCGGFLLYGVQEDIEEHILEYPQLARGLQRFKLGMRRKWSRFDGAGLMPIPPQALSIESTL